MKKGKTAKGSAPRKPKRESPPGVPLIEPGRIPELLARVARPPGARSAVKAAKRWYVVTMPLAHRRGGAERMGFVLAFAESEAVAVEMTREPKLAPGMQRDRVAAVRPASEADVALLRAIPRSRLATRRVWTCWELSGTTASDY